MDFDPVNYILCWTQNWQPCSTHRARTGFLPASVTHQTSSTPEVLLTCLSCHRTTRRRQVNLAPTPTPLTTGLIEEEAPISLHGCVNTALQPAPAFESRTTRGIRRPSGRHFASKTGPPGRRGPHQKHSGEWRSSNKFVGFGRSSVRN